MTKAKCPYCGKYRNLDAHSPHCWARNKIREQDSNPQQDEQGSSGPTA